MTNCHLYNAKSQNVWQCITMHYKNANTTSTTKLNGKRFGDLAEYFVSFNENSRKMLPTYYPVRSIFRFCQRSDRNKRNFVFPAIYLYYRSIAYWQYVRLFRFTSSDHIWFVVNIGSNYKAASAAINSKSFCRRGFLIETIS